MKPLKGEYLLPEKEQIKSHYGSYNENVDPNTDLVIEVVFEDFNVKKDAFNILDKACNEKQFLHQLHHHLQMNWLKQLEDQINSWVYTSLSSSKK